MARIARRRIGGRRLCLREAEAHINALIASETIAPGWNQVANGSPRTNSEPTFQDEEH